MKEMLLYFLILIGLVGCTTMKQYPVRSADDGQRIDIGRKVHLNMNDGSRHEGYLLALEADSIRITPTAGLRRRAMAAAYSDLSSVETQEVSTTATVLIGVVVLVGLLVFVGSRECATSESSYGPC